MRNKLKYTLGPFAALMLLSVQPAWAADPPAPSPFSNTLSITLISLMILLLIIIGILANILLGTADLKMKKKEKQQNKGVASSLMIIGLMLTSQVLFAQDATTTDAAKTASATIGGMPVSTFYVMASVIFLELFIIIALLLNIKFLIKTEKEKIATAAEIAEEKRTKLSWWDKFNKLKPVSEEASLDLGHEYDGIRELNNRLPPWWLYGFYLTIIFAVVYLWRFHVSHTGPSSAEEYNRSVASAELKIKEYLKSKGDAVDENTVTLLTSKEDLAEGKANYLKSCVSCHTETGAGNVGPNLTDNYWLNGNSLKSIFKTIRYGVNAMPQWQAAYSNKQIAQLASYVKSLHGTNPANPKAPQGIEMKEEAVPAADTLKTKPAVDTVKKEENKIVMN